LTGNWGGLGWRWSKATKPESELCMGEVIFRILRFWFFHIVGVFIGFAMIISMLWLAIGFLKYFASR